MPQMAPMLWLLLFFYFIVLFMFFIFTFYFNFLPAGSKSSVTQSGVGSGLIWMW